MMLVPDVAFAPLIRLTGVKRMFQDPAKTRRRMDKRAIRPLSFNPPRMRSDVTISATRVDGVPVYTVAPQGRPSTGHVIYTHGGAWVGEIVSAHWRFIEELVATRGVTATVPIYALVPFGTAQQANDLVLGLYDEASRSGQDVTLAGDSAGGQIALSAALTLRDRGVKDVRTVLIAPALDLTFANPEIEDVKPHDPWLSNEGPPVLADVWRGDLSITDPIVSPLFGDMHGLGPMLVVSGTRDITNPDTHLLVDKARAAGVSVRFVERHEALHVFPLLPTPSGRADRARLVQAFP
ncbi:MAG: alpha/beta hydrolase [Mobilicoccus sp.]|nr:alpha/beta hydrolase [Mobilicoccus sp.]